MDVKSQISFPSKQTPLSRAKGQEVEVTPPSLFPRSNQPDRREAASDNTNSTMIGSDGPQSSETNEVAWLSIAFFLFEGGGGRLEEDEEEGENYLGGKGSVQTQNKQNPIGLKRDGEIPTKIWLMI